MLPKLSCPVAAFCSMPMFLAVLASSAQQLPDSNPPAASETYAASPAIEFRYIAVPATADSIPDAPSAARARRDFIHGGACALSGTGLVSMPGVPLLSQFALSQFGASMGGDIGRTSWFIAFDRYGMDSQHLLAAVAAAQARSAVSLLSVNTNILTLSSMEARVDHRFSAHDSAFGRLTADNARRGTVIRGAEGSPQLVNTRQVNQVMATVANTAEVSPNTVNETRVSFMSNELELPSGAAAGAIQSGLPTTHRDRVFEAANNVYRQIGGQSLRFGGDFLFNQMSISFLESAMGRTPASDSTLSQASRSAGLYFQSQRQVRPNLLLTYGAQYQIQPLRGFKTDTNNLAPQLGFAWSPAARTVIRGGGAIYYDQVPLPAIPGSSDQGGSGNFQSAAAFTAAPGASAPQLTVFTVFNPVLQHSYVETAEFGIEQQLRAHIIVSSDYQFARGLQLAVPAFRPAVLCASAAACSAGNTLHAAEMGTGAASSYQGFTISVTQEPARWGNYRIAYTRSSSEGSGTQGNASYISDDLRRLSFGGVLHTSLTPASDWWQRLSHGFILSGAGDYSTRTEFTGMNFLDLNARLTKTLAWGRHYRLDALAETVNSFERTNAAFAKSFNEFSDRAANVFATYRAVASLQGPTGTHFGLRLGF